MHGIAEIRRANDEACSGVIATLAIPTLETRNIISDTCATIVETCQHNSTWEDRHKDAFALGYVRGRLDQLKADRNPGVASFAATLLAQVAKGGYGFVRTMVGEVTGNDYRA
jgi:hypothetical protein